MILYSRLDIYLKRDAFYIQARPTTVNHEFVNVKDKTLQAQIGEEASAVPRAWSKMNQNKNPGLRANSNILYSTIAGDGSTNAYADMV